MRQRLKYIALTRAQSAVNGRLECRAALDMVRWVGRRLAQHALRAGGSVQGEAGADGCMHNTEHMEAPQG